MTTKQAFIFCITCFLLMVAGTYIALNELAPARDGPCVLVGEERARYMQLAKKHGILGHMILVRDWPDNPWYYDKRGRRIKFK